MVTISSRIKLKHFCFCCYVVKQYRNLYLSGVFNSYVIYEEFIETFKGCRGMCSCASMGVCICRSTYMSMHVEARGQHQLLLWSCLPLHLIFISFATRSFTGLDATKVAGTADQQTPRNPYYLPVSAYHICFFAFFSLILRIKLRTSGLVRWLRG